MSGLYGCPLPIAEQIAKGLLQIRAVQLRPADPFTWSSGWKSPIYCDNRLILSYPILRKLVIDGFQSIVETAFPGLSIVAGAATGGIAHAALLAERLGLPTAYVRSSAKEHGTQKLVEGKAVPGSLGIIIEDTLSTGKSAFQAANALKAEGVEVAAVCTIFSYDFEVARRTAEETGIPAYRLLDYPTLIRVAAEGGWVSQEDVDMLLQWREAPDRYQARA